MPNNEEDLNNNPAFLKYQIEELRKIVEPLIKTVDSLDIKVSLLSQKILLATLLVGGVFQVFGLWYSNRHSEEDKKSYYETKITESSKVVELQAEIDKLKKAAR